MWLVIGFPVSLVMIVVGVHFGYMLCPDHPAALLMGLALARWMYLNFKDFQEMQDEKLDEPEAKHYELTELEAMATIRQVLTYTSLGDKWWHIRDLNLDEGRILASVTFEEVHHRHSDIHFGKELVLGKTQIVLIVSVFARDPGISVRQLYVVTATMGRLPATEVIKALQQAFDNALTARSEAKNAVAEVAA